MRKKKWKKEREEKEVRSGGEEEKQNWGKKGFEANSKKGTEKVKQERNWGKKEKTK